MSPPLLRRLVEHHGRRQRRRLLAGLACVALVGILVAIAILWGLA